MRHVPLLQSTANTIMDGKLYNNWLGVQDQSRRVYKANDPSLCIYTMSIKSLILVRHFDFSPFSNQCNQTEAERRNSLVPFCTMNNSIHYFYWIQGTWPRCWWQDPPRPRIPSLGHTEKTSQTLRDLMNYKYTGLMIWTDDFVLGLHHNRLPRQWFMSLLDWSARLI